MQFWRSMLWNTGIENASSQKVKMDASPATSLLPRSLLFPIRNRISILLEIAILRTAGNCYSFPPPWKISLKAFKNPPSVIYTFKYIHFSVSQFPSSSLIQPNPITSDSIAVRKTMSVKTVKVSNLSSGAFEQDIKEFFSFSGDIEFIEIKSENERSQTAFVTFKDPEGAGTAVLLSGSTIVDQSVDIALAPDYILPATATASAAENKYEGNTGSAVQKAEDVVSSMLAKGFILGKDALNKAKDFDEKHQFTSTASAKVASLDQKIGLSENISLGATMVNDKAKEMDQKFQVSEKTKSTFTAAEQTVSNAGSTIMKNRHILTGVSWVTGAFNSVAKAAGEVGQKTQVKMIEEEQGKNAAEGSAHVHTSDSPSGEVGQKTGEKMIEEEQGKNAAEGYAHVHTSDSP
ncbi:unnamed protein product [Fraxinus pennsylvanica]|uniref:RRM domain-containing protein n=1 Tax=Fraxinus pennsylvanica TaxID=56036 RepID=A0AAD1ZW27_9LAMI|nr:unnamed protein product [Fraxinus pennsylvanica]